MSTKLDWIGEKLPERLTKEPYVWEIRLSGSERDRGTTEGMAEILWHRREIRRQQRKQTSACSHGRPRSTRLS